MCKLHIFFKKGEIFPFTNQVLRQKCRFDTLDKTCNWFLAVVHNCDYNFVRYEILKILRSHNPS